jgi:hypothetical protein
MLRRLGIVALLLVAPGVVRADDVPERLLPAGTQIYLRWDGIEPHRASYEKLALGKMLQGDTGALASSVFSQLQQVLGSAVVQDLLTGTPPEKLQKLQGDSLEAVKALPVLGDHGFILGAELRGLEPPDGQVTLIFPEVGEKPAPLLAALRVGAALANLEIKERNIANRTVFQLPGSPVPAAWWVEGKHLVVTAGTNLPETIIKQLDGKAPALTDNPLFQKLQGFKQFETGTRAFVDIAALAKVGSSRGPEVARILGTLGIDGLKSLTFLSGFDGPVERGLMELEIQGPRKGVLRLLDAKPFKLSDLPALPPDALSWSMTHVDLKVVYDETAAAAETFFKATSPDDLPKLKEVIKELEEGLGVNLRKDLLGALGEEFVQYGSASEGLMTLGQTYLIRVKDSAKLQETIDQAVKGLAKKVGIDIAQKKRMYHGVELREVHVRVRGFPFIPSYTIHKGWLAVSFFPQAIQGYVLRSNGELPAWKPEESTRDALAKLPAEFISVSVTDPRPAVKQLLALAPFVGGILNSGVFNNGGEGGFDVGLIPNAQEATRHLFPNVEVVSLNGNTLRLETRASLALPLDLGNSDSLLLLGFLGSIARFTANK